MVVWLFVCFVLFRFFLCFLWNGCLRLVKSPFACADDDNHDAEDDVVMMRICSVPLQSFALAEPPVMRKVKLLGDQKLQYGEYTLSPLPEWYMHIRTHAALAGLGWAGLGWAG